LDGDTNEFFGPIFEVEFKADASASLDFI